VSSEKDEDIIKIKDINNVAINAIEFVFIDLFNH